MDRLVWIAWARRTSNSLRYWTSRQRFPALGRCMLDAAPVCSVRNWLQLYVRLPGTCGNTFPVANRPCSKPSCVDLVGRSIGPIWAVQRWLQAGWLNDQSHWCGATVRVEAELILELMGRPVQGRPGLSPSIPAIPEVMCHICEEWLHQTGEDTVITLWGTVWWNKLDVFETLGGARPGPTAPRTIRNAAACYSAVGLQAAVSTTYRQFLDRRCML